MLDSRNRSGLIGHGSDFRSRYRCNFCPSLSPSDVNKSAPHRTYLKLSKPFWILLRTLSLLSVIVGEVCFSLSKCQELSRDRRPCTIRSSTTILSTRRTTARFCCTLVRRVGSRFLRVTILTYCRQASCTRSYLTCMIPLTYSVIRADHIKQAFEGLKNADRKVRRPDCTLATVDHVSLEMMIQVWPGRQS
jgi:hypothetical protein